MDKFPRKKIVITDISNEGIGIGRVNNLVIFVNGLIPGDEAEIEILKNKERFSVGRAIKITNPSRQRIIPECTYFDECGGCSLLNFKYKAQLSFKHKKITETVKRLAKFRNFTLEGVIPSDKLLNYRNTALYHLEGSRGKLKAGFCRRRSHEIVDIKKCLIIDPLFCEIINQLRDILKKTVTPESIKLRRLSPSEKGCQVGIYLEGRIKKPADFLKTLPVEVGGIPVFYQLFGGDQRFLGRYPEQTREYYLSEFVHEAFRMKVSLPSFFQVNSGQAEKMLSHIGRLIPAENKKRALLLDLYCGTGIFSLYLASRFNRVLGSDLARTSIEDANANAKFSGISNASYQLKDADTFVKGLRGERKFDTILVDPPRTGITPHTLKFLCEARTEFLIYISCDPATLSRDLKYLFNSGYYPVGMTPFDLFPQTPHVETVVLLRKE